MRITYAVDGAVGADPYQVTVRASEVSDLPGVALILDDDIALTEEQATDLVKAIGKVLGWTRIHAYRGNEYDDELSAYASSVNPKGN